MLCALLSVTSSEREALDFAASMRWASGRLRDTPMSGPLPSASWEQNSGDSGRPQL